MLKYSVRKRTEKINPKVIFQIIFNDFLLIEDNSFCFRILIARTKVNHNVHQTNDIYKEYRKYLYYIDPFLIIHNIMSDQTFSYQ